jgi:hypothetical protein
VSELTRPASQQHRSQGFQLPLEEATQANNVRKYCARRNVLMLRRKLK